VLGSPQYMSIEQFQNSKGLDRRSDIWALGMVLHHLLTGRTAYEAADVAAYLFKLSTELPKPVREHRADVPAAIEAVILRCLEKNPNARFYHVGEFAHALAPFAGPRSAGALARIQHYAAATPRIAAAPAPQENLRAISAHSVYGQTSVQSGTNDAVMRENVTLSGSRRNVALGVVVAAVVVMAAVGLVLQSTLPGQPPSSGEQGSSARIAAAPATVVITVAVNPAHATLELDGQTVKSPIELPSEDKERTLVVRAEGYASKTKTFRTAANAYLEVSLDTLPPPSIASEAGSPRTSRVAPGAAPSPAPASTNRKKLKGPMADSL
jgi:Protein tyrosine and serine/threonine kinase/PEGA domain